MTGKADREVTIDEQARKALAKELFNLTWELLEAKDRTTEQDERMVHASHASRFLWGEVGEPENLAVGDWQISRVYAVLGRAEPAIHHARNSLATCERDGLGDFVLAFAHEALARAHAVEGDLERAEHHAREARAAADDIAEDDDRELLLSDLATLPL